MNVLTIYVGGVPASGKSTLFRCVRQRLFAHSADFKDGCCRGVFAEGGKLLMLGVFDGSMFEGTDRLAMTAIDDCLSYIRKLEGEGERKVVFVEGDRLLCDRFIRATRARLILIDAHPRVLEARQRGRRAQGHCQSNTFLKAKRTKVQGMATRWHCPLLPNNTPAEQARILDRIVGEARRWLNG